MSHSGMIPPIKAQQSQATSTIAILMIVATGVLLAGMDATAKYLAINMPVLLVLWGRYFFHTSVTFFVYAAKRRSFRFLYADSPVLQLIRAASLFGATGSLYVAITIMPLGDAAAIQFLAPVILTVISGVFLGEYVGLRRSLAVLVAFAGVLLVARPGYNDIGWSALLPVMTAFLLAVYMLMTRLIRSKDNSDTTTFYSTAVGAAVLTIIVPFYWQPLSFDEWSLMLTMGLAGAAGHYFLVKAFQSTEASFLAPFTYAQVVAAIAWGYLIFEDVPSVWTIIGATLIIGSGIYVWYRETKLNET